jgi:hypothetical protein
MIQEGPILATLKFLVNFCRALHRHQGFSANVREPAWSLDNDLPLKLIFTFDH